MSLIKAVVEIPKGSRYKYEVDKVTGQLILDRPLFHNYPENYGYFPDTLAEDGDPLDVFIISTEPLIPLSVVKVEILGVIKCLDNGEVDDKLVAYIIEHEKLKDEKYLIIGIERFLSHYKDGFQVLKYEDATEAQTILDKCKERHGKSQGTCSFGELPDAMSWGHTGICMPGCTCAIAKACKKKD